MTVLRMPIEPVHRLRGRQQNAQLQLCVPPVTKTWTYPNRSGAELAVQVADRFGVVLHRRTVERARRR